MSEIRALLLTDAIDSTRLTERLGDAVMATYWEAHNRAARDLLIAWRGFEIEKTDGLLAVFDDASDAASFALRYHEAIAELTLPFKLRAGLHVGAVGLSENMPADVAVGARRYEPSGLAISVVARVTALARGGQTLLTAAAREALKAPELRVRSHGYWRLKGLDEPMELFEVGDGRSSFIPPPDELKAYRVVRLGDLWIPVRDISHSIPAERNSFVGRREPMVEIAAKYRRGARLVSILGIGGTGKTRLATHFAWTWLGDYPGGAWFCDLSQARNVDGIAFAVSQGLDVPLGKAEPVAHLGRAIAGRKECLVILDNFEQVARHAEETLGRWLDQAPEARFLVTSREVLGVAGEEALALPPLPVTDAAELFASRARSAWQQFVPSPEDTRVIAELAKVLDGLPLAIELAAARVRVMSPGVLLEQMRERFDMLVSPGGRRDRQATLRATFDWSWDLLSEVDRSALAQLSVFEGGFSFESAEAVLELPSGSRLLDVIQSLVDKSLVRRVGDDRFDLLESVRVYASEQLRSERAFRGSGKKAAETAERRHGEYFAALGPRRAVEGACIEMDNLVAACKRAVARADANIAVGALAGAFGAVKLRGPLSLGIEMSSLVGSIALSPRSMAVVRRIRGYALMLSGQTAEARAQLELAVVEANEVSDPTIAAIAVANLGELAMREGRAGDALSHFTAALASGPELVDPTFECGVLSSLGSCHEYLGQLDVAERYYQRTLDRAREAGERRWEGGALGNLGQLNATRGRLDEAREYYEAALKIAREICDRQWEGNVRSNLGLLHSGEGRMQEAEYHLAAALCCARELGHPRLECIVLCNLGIVADAAANPEEAHRCYLQSADIARMLGDRRSEGQILGYLGLSHARLGRYDEAQRCMEAGSAYLCSVNDRISLGVLLCAHAEASYLAGNLARARELHAEVRQMATQIDAGPKSEFGVALTKVGALLGEPAPRVVG